MACLSLENSIFLASVNCALPDQEATTVVITPDGECLANLAYGNSGMHIVAIDPNAVNRLYASRPQALFDNPALPIPTRANRRQN
jgi:predicted amidohydrolase